MPLFTRRHTHLRSCTSTLASNSPVRPLGSSMPRDTRTSPQVHHRYEIYMKNEYKVYRLNTDMETEASAIEYPDEPLSRNETTSCTVDQGEKRPETKSLLLQVSSTVRERTRSMFIKANAGGLARKVGHKDIEFLGGHQKLDSRQGRYTASRRDRRASRSSQGRYYCAYFSRRGQHPVAALKGLLLNWEPTYCSELADYAEVVSPFKAS